MRRVAPVVAAALAALGLGGCIPSVTLRTGHPIVDNQVKAIVPGITTKTELFERFGAPAGIAARGEIVTIAFPATRPAPYPGETSCPVDADTFFELFPGAREPDEYRRVYYFRHVVNRKMNFFMLLALYGRGSTNADRLWALVNEKTGIVEDYAFKKSGALVLFGKPRPAGAR